MKIKFDKLTRDKIEEIVKKVIRLSGSTPEVTITSDEFAYLELADLKDFPTHSQYLRIQGKELLMTGYYAQVGDMKIKVENK